jgi:hypothetical protein
MEDSGGRWFTCEEALVVVGMSTVNCFMDLVGLVEVPWRNVFLVFSFVNLALLSKFGS